ncbi:unnamed protein product [Calypogeia fissa]
MISKLEGPTPIAVPSIAHFAQHYSAKSFAKYDYEELQNSNLYKCPSLPKYNVATIPAIPLLLIHGGNDALADRKDVNPLVQLLKFQLEVALLSNYGHLDFVLGMSVKVDCDNKVLAFLSS